MKLTVKSEQAKKVALYSTGDRNTTTSDNELKKVVMHAGLKRGLCPKRAR
jgi:hypothetical protein